MRNSNKVLFAAYVFFITLLLVIMIIIKIGINKDHEIKYQDKPDIPAGNTFKTAEDSNPYSNAGGVCG